MTITIELHYRRTTDPAWCEATEFTVLGTDSEDFIGYCGFLLGPRSVGNTYHFNTALRLPTPRHDWLKINSILFHYVEIKEGRRYLSW